MKRSELIRGLVALILLGLFTHAAVLQAAKPPRRRTVPASRFPGPCVPTVVINSVAYDPEAQDIDISYTERCSAGTDTGCPIAIAEILYWWNERTGAWVEVDSGCSQSSMACGGSGTIYTTSSFDMRNWRPGNTFLYGVNFFRGSCANQTGLLASATIEFSN